MGKYGVRSENALIANHGRCAKGDIMCVSASFYEFPYISYYGYYSGVFVIAVASSNIRATKPVIENAFPPIRNISTENLYC